MSMSQHAVDVETSAQITRIMIRAALQDLHDSINALGGQPADDYSRGVHDTVASALAIIEAKQAEVRDGA